MGRQRDRKLATAGLLLVAGFLVVGIVFFVARPDIAEIGPRWIWPVPALALGLLVFLYGVKRIPRTDRVPAQEEAEPDDQPVDEGSGVSGGVG